MSTLESQFIRLELLQRREEGCNVSVSEDRVEAAVADTDTDDATFISLYDDLVALETEPSFPYDEPSSLDEIRAARPDGPRRITVALSDEELKDRIYGAWLGRAAGCSLGKPVEGWPRERIDKYLESAGALPLDDYIPYVENAMSPRLRTSTRGNIEFMARDDDMDYPILGLIALERKGNEFTPRTMANVWLGHMPYHLLYTAENAAYRNFVNGHWPPESALHRNPYREWIGAQIRADIFGYVAPGWPEKAADFAFRDASISHVKNGIYGEMFVAAMLAAAVTTDDISEIIEIGLSEIPENCRLSEAVRDTLNWCGTLDDWEAVWDRINDKYGHYHGVHTINNAALVVLGLYFGAQDFEQGIVVSVRGGWDTDCNGATVGSILGAKFGAAALPEKWIGVLSDRLMSSVCEFNDNRISELAERTHRVAQQISQLDETESALEPVIDGDPTNFLGTWRMTLPHAAYIVRINPDLTGEIEMESFGEKSRVKQASVKGHQLQFTFGIDKGGWETELTFDGKIDGDTFAGTCTSSGYEFEASAVRIAGTLGSE